MAKKAKKRVLLTGGTGFIGANLLPRLIAAGYEITLLARPEKVLKKYPKSVKVIRMDLVKSIPSAEMIGNPDVIIHLAGSAEVDKSLQEPEEHVASNLSILLNVLRPARLAEKKPLFIYSSTDRSYGRTKNTEVDEQEPVFPIEPYTASKIMGEKIIEAYNYLYDIPYVIFRIDSVYGPGQPTRMFISEMIHKMLRGEKIVTGGLDTQKNFVYVGDLAEAFLAAIESSAAAQNNIYNVGGKPYSLKDVLQILDKAVEKKTGRKNSLTIGGEPLKRSQKNEVKQFLLSTKKISDNLNWRSKTALAEGIDNTINHFISQYEK